MTGESHEPEKGLGVRYSDPPISEKKDRRAQDWAATDGRVLRDREEYVWSWLLQPIMFVVAVVPLASSEPAATLSDFLYVVGAPAAISLGAAMFTRARVVVHPDAFTVVNLFRTYHIPDGNVANAALEPTGYPTIFLTDGTDITITALQESPIRRFFDGTLAGHAFNYVLARGEHHPPQGPVTTTRTRWNTAQKALAVTWLVIAAAHVVHAATLAA